MRHHKKGRDAPPNRGGRPCAFTPARLVALFRAVADGESREDAARSAGISKRTLQRWIKAGRDGDERFVELAAALATAEQLAGWGQAAGKAIIALSRRGAF